MQVLWGISSMLWPHGAEQHDVDGGPAAPVRGEYVAAAAAAQSESGGTAEGAHPFTRKRVLAPAWCCTKITITRCTVTTASF